MESVSLPTHAQRRSLVPDSYFTHLVEESEPGNVNDLNLRPCRSHPIYPGPVHFGMTVWYEQGRWRSEFDWHRPPPEGFAALVTYGAPYVNFTSGSDGHRIWTTDRERRTVFLSSYCLAGTRPPSEGFLRRFAQVSELNGVLGDNFHCTSGTLRGVDEIAGRRAWVVEFGEDRCPRRAKRPPPCVHDGRMMFWVDAETFFTLREDQYACGASDHLILSTRVTSIEYNWPLEPELFEFFVPPGYTLVENE
jgi:hypothetical protein